MTPRPVALVGPTATGKSDLALALARRLGPDRVGELADQLGPPVVELRSDRPLHHDEDHPASVGARTADVPVSSGSTSSPTRHASSRCG